MPASSLLRDHAAGDAVAGVAGGIGFVVVGFGVDDDRGAAVAEQRVLAVEGHVQVLNGCTGAAFCVDDEVLHIASVVAFRIIESVLLAFRIEMGTGRFKIRGIALGVLMKVDSVFAGRQIVKHEFEADARTVWHDDDRSYILALGVLDVDLGFGCAGKSENHQRDNRS